MRSRHAGERRERSRSKFQGQHAFGSRAPDREPPWGSSSTTEHLPRSSPGRYLACVITTALTVVGQPGITDWLTAVGTVAVALVAVGVALFAEWRASVRVQAERSRSDQVLADERARSDQVLADERAAADKRLKSQQEHSDRQFYAAQNTVTRDGAVHRGVRRPGHSRRNHYHAGASERVRRPGSVGPSAGSPTLARMLATA